MQWRRGCLLAAVNLTTAIPLILYMEWQDARYTKACLEPAVVEAAQESATVPFDPCQGMWASYPPQEQVVQFGNVPVFIVTAWRMECPPRWSVAGMLHINDAPSTYARRIAQKRFDLIFCVLIALQWFLLGSFPLTPPTAWWREPGMLITLCTALATCIALIAPIDVLARLLALAAFLAWLYWGFVAAYRALRFAWKHTAGPLLRRAD
jgi:hypothetical protein